METFLLVQLLLRTSDAHLKLSKLQLNDHTTDISIVQSIIVSNFI